MADDTQFVRSYLLPPRNAFWRWDDDGEVICWLDGRTIAFRAELAETLTDLAPQGLPPLGAVLLLLAAARDNWGEAESCAALLAGELKGTDHAWANLSTLYDVVEGLDRVHLVDPEVRATRSGRAALCSTVLAEASDRTTPQAGAAIAAHVARGLADFITEPEGRVNWRRAGATDLIRNLNCLRHGLTRVESDQLRLRARTGLDELPRTRERELPASEKVRALLTELRDDASLSGLARLAFDLMAAVTIPRPVTQEAELQVGGVSDITNRGPLDRLLLSELAHDDLTLAVRVAVNEALYLRRESPPRMPPRQRTMLLEAGISSWGVPRLFSTAVALAFAATVQRNTDLMVYRASGAHVVPVDLTTRAGLVDHLEALDHALHPGGALPEFRLCTEQANQDSEPIVITTDGVFRDDGFQQAVAEHLTSPLHLACVDRRGHLQLFERTPRGTKRLREARLDLDALSSPHRNKNTLIDPELACRLPAIVSQEPFPLLLCHNVDPKAVWEVAGHGLLAIAPDRRLMLWQRSGQGARQIADDLPKKVVVWWSADECIDGRTWAVVGSSGRNRLYLLEIDLDAQRCITKPLNVKPGICTVCSHNGGLFAVYRDEVDVLDLATAEVTMSLRLPRGMRWQRTRFFRGSPSRTWYALSFDANAACLEVVLDERAVRCPKLLTLFDRVGVEGPLGITTKGDVYSTSNGELSQIRYGISGTLSVEAVSCAGDRVALISDKGIRRVLHTDSLEVSHYWSDTPNIHTYVVQQNVRKRFMQMGLVDGQLALTSRRQDVLVLEYHAATDAIRLRPKTAGLQYHHVQPFVQMPAPPGVGYRLSRAEWNDGSAAFLDSRGILHLKSSDESLPEVSIVLTDSELGGWCADGRFWGSRYSTGKETSAPKRQFYESVICAFADRLA